MVAEAMTLPEDYDELKEFTTQLLAEIKAQAMLIEKLRHQVAGQKAWRYGSTSEQSRQLMLALETSEIAEAAMTAKMKLPPPLGDALHRLPAVDEPKDKPRRRPIPDHIPRNNIELLPPKDHCRCGGPLRQIGEDITEELEYVPGRFVVNRIARPRYACKRCERFTQAVLPSRPRASWSTATPPVTASATPSTPSATSTATASTT